jgi:hypothetical protein
MPPTNISPNTSTTVSTTEERHGDSSKALLCGESNQAFNPFWAKYPRKTGKDRAARLWLTMGLDAIADEVMAGLDRWLQSEEWVKENGRYIPSPAKWLAEKRWLDEPKPVDDDLPEYWKKTYRRN